MKCRAVEISEAMTTKSVVLIVILVLVGGVYVWKFTDWFTSPKIQILPQIRPPQRTRRPSTPATDPQVYPVTFAFDKKYQFTEIRVVAEDDEKTNKYPHALWHLISDSNSVPTKALIYGAPLRGMKPKVPRAEPDQLEPEVTYNLYLTAGKAEGKVKFKTQEFVKPNTAQ
jgi:hypothetical protein